MSQWVHLGAYMATSAPNEESVSRLRVCLSSSPVGT
ncbi:MAG: hypothetical protein QOG87_3586 [Actinomycetota bacterium]|jgi:hypothetical protein